MLNNIDLFNILVLDIETVPQYASFDEVPTALQKLWATKTQNQRKDETPDEFYQRAGIWAEFGKVICIAAGVFTRGEQTGFRVKAFAGHDEALLLKQFASMLKKQPANMLLCAHNGKEFDFPYLCRRMLINGINLPPQLDLAGKKPWEIGHLDTMELWKFGDYKNFTSLSLLTEIFGIPSPKDDIDGSMVGSVYWQHNDIERIAKYCEKDVVATAQLLRRYRLEDLIAEAEILYV